MARETLNKCFIRGHMSKDEDYIKNDPSPLRREVIDCPFRTPDGKALLTGETVYGCLHPAARSWKTETERVRKMKDGGIVMGGMIDDYAAFCEPVDHHLISLGEPSRLAVDAEIIEEENPELPSGSEIQGYLEPGETK